MPEMKLPCSPEAEKAVLGSILIEPDCAEMMAERLCPEDFFLPENRAVFEAIRAVASQGQTVDAVTVLEEMRKSGTDGGMRDRLAEMLEITPTSANAMEYAAVVQEKARLRDARTAEETGAPK